jgi:hypothetical protein
MAHFAELDGSNVVTRVVVVDNSHVPSDKHADGETWCVNFFGGGTWKQTSYNNKFRKQYAGKGDTYDAAKDKFISPQPYASWALDGSDDWQAPISKPDDGKYYSWNETLYQGDNTKGWVEWTPEE